MTAISSHLPDLVDAYITARAQRLTVEKQVDELKSYEEMIKDAIISKMREGKMTAVGADLGLVKLAVLKEPVATNWPEVWDYIKDKGAWDLLHKRLTSTAVKARWEEGEQIPGVGVTEVYKLTVSKTS